MGKSISPETIVRRDEQNRRVCGLRGYWWLPESRPSERTSRVWKGFSPRRSDSVSLRQKRARLPFNPQLGYADRNAK